MKQTGTRKLGSSPRFSRVKPNTLPETIMEAVDNMFTYGDSSGSIEYEEDKATAIWTFKNDGTDDNLPSYEQMVKIIETTGEEISTKKGASLKGEGIEVLALAARKRSQAIVEIEIEICRNRQLYGARLTYNGKTKEVTTEYDSEPREIDRKNYFKLSLNDTNPFTMKEYDIFKKTLAIKYHYLLEKNPNFKLVLKDSMGTHNIIPVNMSYDEVLPDTHYQLKSYTYKNSKGEKECLFIKMSNVHDVIRTNMSNNVDDLGVAQPEFAGIYFVTPNGIATTTGGTHSWSLIKKGNDRHSTKNAIRIIVYGGWELFNQLYVDSPLKKKPTTSFFDFRDEYGDEISFIDNETNESCTIKDICLIIDNFVAQHRTGKTNETTDVNNIVFDNLLENEIIYLFDLINKIEVNKNVKFNTVVNSLKKIIQKNNEVTYTI